MTPIPVLYAVPRMAIGGTPRHLLQVLEHLDRRRFAPVLYCLKAWPENPFLAEVRRLGVEMIDGRTGATFRGLRWVPPVVRLAGELRRRRIKVVHGYLLHANFLAAVAGRLARVPAILVSKRGIDHYDRLSDAWTARIGNRLAHRVTTNAEALRRHLVAAEGCRADRVVVIPNGVALGDAAAPPRAWPGVPADALVVGAIGRLAPKKSQGDLLEAAPLVLDRVPQAWFVIVGDGPDRAALEARARALNVAGRVVFTGARGDGHQAVRGLDVFVLPSRSEGMSNALLEAMAAARPVVATDVGGNPEVLGDGETGILVPPAEPLRMADAIVTLLKDPERAAAMGAAGRRRVAARFTIDGMVRGMERLYTDLLAAAGAHGE